MQFLRRFAICLAIATWCFLTTWVELAEGDSVYYARFNPVATNVIPVLCWELIIALALWAVWELIRRVHLEEGANIALLCLAASAVPFGIGAVAALRLSPWNLLPFVRYRWLWPAAAVAAIVPVVLAIRRPRLCCRVLASVFLYSWPVLALLMFQGLRTTIAPYPAAAYEDGPLATRLEDIPRVRVVWIIFDELSQAIAFSGRPAGLALPNLDQARAESFFATAAKSPADSTQLSMPALTLGEDVVEATQSGTRDLRLKTRTRSEPFSWNAVPNVFDDARGLGFNTALVGWFHPYGRLLNRSLTKCFWVAGWQLPGIEESFQPPALASAMADRLKLQFITLPLVGHLPMVQTGIYERRSKRERYSYLMTNAKQVVADPSVGLALVHLSLPHPPSLGESAGGYLEGVRRVDESLGALRRAMIEAHLWDRSAVLISADHGWRTSIWRGTPDWNSNDEAASRQDTSGVPFLLKLPGQAEGAVYNKPFNTVVTRQVIDRILEGQLTDAGDIAESIERIQLQTPSISNAR